MQFCSFILNLMLTTVFISTMFTYIYIMCTCTQMCIVPEMGILVFVSAFDPAPRPIHVAQTNITTSCCPHLDSSHSHCVPSSD